MFVLLGDSSLAMTASASCAALGISPFFLDIFATALVRSVGRKSKAPRISTLRCPVRRSMSSTALIEEVSHTLEHDRFPALGEMIRVSGNTL